MDIRIRSINHVTVRHGVTGHTISQVMACIDAGGRTGAESQPRGRGLSRSALRREDLIDGGKAPHTQRTLLAFMGRFALGE